MPRADLVLEGGGVKGIALVGALSVLSERGYTFEHVAGTSAGAIVASLVAVGYTGKELRDIVAGTNYAEFEDGSRFGILGEAVHLLARDGLFSGRFARGYIGDLLAERRGKGPVTFGQLAYTDPDGRPPRPGRESRLVVMASDVTAGRLRRFPWDYPVYGIDPGTFEVADAVRASMSIPFFFRPVTLHSEKDGRDHLLVDGGMLSNFPVDVFDAPAGVEPRWPTFGIKLSARPSADDDVDSGLADADGLIDLTKAMVATMTGFYDRMHLDDPAVTVRTIFVDTMGVKSTDFHLPRETADQLFENGRAAATAFLDGVPPDQAAWDWEGYKTAYRPVAATA